MINLINAAIKFNYDSCYAHSNIHHMSKYAANKELRTVHINCGRQTGKTHSMMQLARTDDLIIVRVEEDVRRLKNSYPDCLADIITYGNLVYYRRNIIPSSTSYDRVWLDESGYFRESIDSEKEYYHLSANIFIKLGE